MPPQNGIINITCNILNSNLVLAEDNIETNFTLNEIYENENRDEADINKYVIKFEMEAKIKEENKFSLGIGILCYIPSKNIKALITYNHMINFDFLNYGQKMVLYINKKEHEINFKINRYKYTNEDLDISIIEILDEDNINNLIEIDKFFNSRNYVGIKIMSISLNQNKDFEYSNGEIINKNNDNYICDIKSEKEGIIVLEDSRKLIGIIKENNNEINMIPMNVIINKINFIKCLYEIKKEDIGKDIQIINNLGRYKYTIQNEEIEKEIKVIIKGEIKSNILKYKFNE